MGVLRTCRCVRVGSGLVRRGYDHRTYERKYVGHGQLGIVMGGWSESVARLEGGVFHPSSGRS